MSARKNKSIIVWILIILLIIVALGQTGVLKNPLVVLPEGYRAYQWSVVYHIETNPFPPADQMTTIGEIRSDLTYKTVEKLTEYTDDHGDAIVVNEGPHTVVVGSVQTSSSGSNIIAIFDLNVTTGFYGYFPNGIPDVPSPASMMLFPVVYALAPIIIAIIVIAICTAIVVIGLVAVIIYLANKIEQVLTNPNIPEPLKWLFTILASLMALGPIVVIVIGGIIMVLLFTGGGGRRRGR